MIYIILCTYNGEKYLNEQLQSIIDNTEADWKLIISDDQSTDYTLGIARQFQRKYPEKIVIDINKKPKGAIANFLDKIYQVGLHMEEKDHIMLCDQDDVWNPDKISKTIDGMRALERNHGNNIPLLVCTDVTVVDEEMNVLYESFHNMNHYNIKKLDFPHLMMENKVQGCTVMLNRRLALMLERIPEKATMHDGWLALVAAAFGKIKYIDEPTMKYRQHENNVQGSVVYKEDIRNKFLNLGAQRQIVMNTTLQMAEFLEVYGTQLSSQTQKEATAFATLPRQGFWIRRYHIIKYHMWKTGVLRNVGLMVLI